MKVLLEVSENQRSTLDYIRADTNLSRALDTLVTAITMLAEGAAWESLPPGVRENKAFDGSHAESRWLLQDLLSETDELQLGVCRGFLAQEEGDLNEVVRSQCERSDRFIVAFRPTHETQSRDSFGRGIEFIIFLDGTIHPSGNSAGGLTAM